MTGATADASARWAVVAVAAGLRPAADPVLAPSHSNDTWLLEDERWGAAVLRVCWRGDVARLPREAAVGAALPAAVGYPAVLGAGTTADGALSWTLTRRLPGCSLRTAWPGLGPGGRRDAVDAVVDALAALHAFRPPPSLRPVLRLAPLPAAPSVDAVVGRSMSPWPDGVGVLLAAASDRAPADLVAAVRRLLERDAALGPALDAASPTLVHGDLHLDNVWTDGQRVTGLLDLEWVRPAPPWVELARVADEVDQDVADGVAGHAQLLAGLRRRLPGLEAVDRLPARLRLWRVAYQLRELVLWPVTAPAEAPPDHPVRLLAVLVGAG
ncbi:aminoglycoside phosphotransferase family protein [Microlunatus capsulatus]|uniref:phosphotransferase family protein n=1 Tax=Microlunatus capsulatus TaxID=99117 RepID=UPI0031E0638C